MPTTAHFKVSDTDLTTLTQGQQKTLTGVDPIDGVLRRIENRICVNFFMRGDLHASNRDDVTTGLMSARCGPTC